MKARNPRTVLLLMITLNWDLELCHREILKLSKALKWLRGVGPVHPAMHGKRTIGLVVQTEVSAIALMDSLGHVLQEGCFESVRCLTPGKDIVSNIGSMDPVVVRVSEAWAEVRKWNDPQNMRPPKAREIFVKRGIKDADRRAAVKMGFKPRGSRQQAQ